MTIDEANKWARRNNLDGRFVDAENFERPSPPPDVVEAARRLMTDLRAEYTPHADDIETVCKWVVGEKS